MPEHGSHSSVDPAVAGISIRPFRHGRFSGDQAGVWLEDGFSLVCMADGLGHGEDAEIAARKAVETAAANRDLAPCELMHACDEALRGSRGAAVALARLDQAAGVIEYVGVGNTRCVVVGHSNHYLGGTYGVVGEGVGTLAPESYPLGRRDVVIFWTDGLPDTLPLVGTRVRRVSNAQAYADNLLDQHAIDDDAGVVVLRWTP